MPTGGSYDTARCWVPGCVNQKIPDRFNTTVKLFKFPAADLPRCRKWLKAVGSTYLLSLTTQQVKAKFICCAHFRDYEIRKNKVKTTLVTSAFPSQFPPEVCPLPDELVEQWPQSMAKENQCGRELDSSECQLQTSLSASTPRPLQILGLNQVSAAGVHAGGSSQQASLKPDSGSKMNVDIHFLDDPIDSQWELVNLVLYRHKEDRGFLRAISANLKVEPPRCTVVVVQ
ncbi:uncharacterized protein LOC117640385 [Thrips palmi]|uniref:Uncharacterized protein LOC117640385 n=1 Tax=Thrips palmi TaxID=161013 RepID=A0A6P8ZI03_THRPL|nr:uncharacterized protein LOC117640385 [Thrips palmi]